MGPNWTKEERRSGVKRVKNFLQMARAYGLMCTDGDAVTDVASDGELCFCSIYS